MKKILFLFFLNSGELWSGGFCSHNKGQSIHADFCSRVNQENCLAHVNICNWTEVDEPRKKYPRPSHTCRPRRGAESLEEACAEYEETMCKAYSRLCEWK